ncbi:MAG: hypothetical protein ABSB67_04650 [Bryobacteraceae bacterium]|jgi:hypothetical protein
MNSNDELRDLWQQPAGDPARTGEDMLTLVIEKTRKMDRQIAIRNTRECLAAAAVTIFFGWFAWRAPGSIERIGWTITALSGIWIAFYILRFGKGPGQPDRTASVMAYSSLLAENYDRQIRLLRNVKYWYLLPIWVGMAIGMVGASLRTHEQAWVLAVKLSSVTATFAFIWALNEWWGVRYLRRLKEQLPRNN